MNHWAARGAFIGICLSVYVSLGMAADWRPLVHKLNNLVTFPPCVKTNSAGEVFSVRLSGQEATAENLNVVQEIHSLKELAVNCPRDNAIKFEALTNVMHKLKLEKLRLTFISGDFDVWANVAVEMTALTELTLCWIDITPAMTNLAKIKTLRSLSLKECHNLNLSDVEKLLAHSQIAELTVSASSPTATAQQIAALRSVAKERKVRLRYQD